MAEIDHLVYVVPDLDAAADHLERAVGVRPEIGGRHPGMGTWNALLALDVNDGPDCYLELIAADPDQPQPAGRRPFGIDDDTGPRMVTFAVRPAADETIDDLVSILVEHDHDPGPTVPMSRTTPAGDELHWRLTFPTLAAEGYVPFLIDWGDTPNPATTIDRRARLDFLGGTAPSEVRPLLAALRPPGLELGTMAVEPLSATIRVGDRTLRL